MQGESGETASRFGFPPQCTATMAIANARTSMSVCARARVHDGNCETVHTKLT